MNLKLLNLVVILVFLLVLSKNTNALQKYGLQDVCGNQLTGQIQLKGPIWGIESSAILVPRSYYSYKANTSCTVSITSSPARYGTVVSIRKIDLRPNSVDKLTIRYRSTYDREKEFRNIYSFRSRQYDDKEYESYQSTTNLTITFNTGNSILSTGGYDGFELIVTSVSDPPCSGTFRCDSRICIAEELKCDGHNHCTDRSDQSQYNCETSNTSSHTGDSVVLYVFVVIGVVVVVCCLLVFCSKNCNSTSTSTTYSRRDSGPSTVYLPYPGDVQTSSYHSSTYVGGSSYSTYESTYDADTAAPAYESTYTGDYAAPSYESTYAGESAAPAYESTYEGDSAAPCYSAYD